WFGDAYYTGNATVLSDSTLPAAWSTWRVPTGVRIDRISSRDTLMSFDARVRDVKASRRIPDRGGAAETGSIILPDGGLLVIDALGRGWLAGTDTPVFSIGKPFVTLPALAPRSGSGEPDGIVAGDRDGYLHKIKVGDWDEFEGWPAFIAGSFVSHPVVFSRDGESFVAAVDGSSRIHLIGPSGVESRGSPLFLSNHVISNIVVSQTGGEGTGLFLVVGDTDPLRAWLVKLSLFPGQSGDAFGYASGYPQRLLLDADDVEGGVYLVGGDIVPEQEGDEVYVACRLTGRILCCGSRGVISDRHRERTVAAPPALFDLNGDSYLDLVYSDGSSIYAIGPSGANLTGWPRDLNSFRALPWEARVGTPPTVLGWGSEGVVVAGSDGGLLYLVRGSGELLGDYPRKVSGPMDHAIDIWEGGSVPCLVVRDGPLAKWREAPAAGGGWLTLWGDDSRTAWAPRSTASGSAGKWLAERGDFVVYPNPSRGDRIGFHFAAPREGTAHLEILTLAGELVLERDKQMTGGEDEFVVSMKDKASGVYLCRLVITSEGRRIEANRKFAVVR
ncbi:MAG: T9SS type A sorting domain-containing protein, partial [Candidatus Krumholzibacteriaceae bacterium]